METKVRNSLYIGVILGLIVFYAFYGVRILDGTWVEWLMASDKAQHFFGWHFFRHEPWQNPLGLIISFGAPQVTSIGYTDSIPLVAIFLKIFSDQLPPVFQYMGLWTLGCCLLQGITAALLMARLTNCMFIQIIGVAFFLLSPIMHARAICGHEALMAHWLFLCAFLLFFYEKSWKCSVGWMGLVSVSAAIHPYLWLMTISLAAIYSLQVVWLDSKKNWKYAICLFLGVVAGSLLVQWQVGYFSFHVEAMGNVGFGNWSMNLNALINPMDKDVSAFLPLRPLASSEQVEGFNYLGLGVLGLSIISVVRFSWSLITKKKIIAFLPIEIGAMFFLFLALSNKITIDQVILLTYSLPGWDQVNGVFRSAGRFFWPLYYMIIFLSLWGVISRFSHKKATLILSFFLIIQIMDLSPFITKAEAVMTAAQWKFSLNDAAWFDIGAKYRNLVLVPAGRTKDDYIDYAYLAGSHKMSINTNSAAREEWNEVLAYRNTLNRKVARGIFEEEACYIIRKKEWMPVFFLAIPSQGFLAEIDGQYVYAPNWRPQNETVIKKVTFPGWSLDHPEVVGSYDIPLGKWIRAGVAEEFSKYGVAGWNRPEGEHIWSDGYAASLIFRIPEEKEFYQMTLDVAPFIYSMNQTQKVVIFANGRYIDTLNVNHEGQYTVKFSRGLLKERFLLIEFRLPDAVNLAQEENFAQRDQRTLGIALRKVRFD